MSKLAISNIAWPEYLDGQVYGLMERYGFSGLEIAPTRVFPEAPYDRLGEASAWAVGLKEQYGLIIPSIQSIWYGRQEALFGTEEERGILLDHTKKAIDFAAAIGCRNLVFGCPKNRRLCDGADLEVGIRFFRTIGDYACSKGIVVGMEANPSIYGTDYINDTEAAFRLIGQVGSEGFRLDLDTGTMIQNGEEAAMLEGRVRHISHVHISEPWLKPIQERELHRELERLLDAEGYHGYVSIEMGRSDDIRMIEDVLRYVREVFA